MNQSILKTCLGSGLVLCGGFAILCFLEGQSIWIGWTFGFCALLIVYLMSFHPKKKVAKEPHLRSILSSQAKEALATQAIPKKESLDPNFPLNPKEYLVWADQMCTDYYNSKPHLVYLTNQRLVCLEPDFAFSHPLSHLEIAFFPDKLKLQKNKKNIMTFKVASLEAFQQAWMLVKKDQ